MQTIWVQHTADAQDARSETSMDSDDDAAESSADARASPQQQGAQAAPRDVEALLPARVLSQIDGPGPSGVGQAAKCSGKGAARHEDGTAEKQIGNRSDNGGRGERSASDVAAVNTPELGLEGAQDGAGEGGGGTGKVNKRPSSLKGTRKLKQKTMLMLRRMGTKADMRQNRKQATWKRRAEKKRWGKSKRKTGMWKKMQDREKTDKGIRRPEGARMKQDLEKQATGIMWRAEMRQAVTRCK